MIRKKRQWTKNQTLWNSISEVIAEMHKMSHHDEDDVISEAKTSPLTVINNDGGLFS